MNPSSKKGKTFQAVPSTFASTFATISVLPTYSTLSSTLRILKFKSYNALASFEHLFAFSTILIFCQANWKWGRSASHKAPQITVDLQGLTASRATSQGQNPAVFTSSPFTRRECWYRVQIVKLGTWIGIGFADANFVLFGNKTLGNQTTGLNSSYFWQDSGIRKIQIHGEPITEVKDICIGDKIDVFVDFDNNSVYFFNNGKLQGVITPQRYNLNNFEGKIWPCVDLSNNSVVTLVNADCPLINLDQKAAAFHWKWSTQVNRKAAAISVSKNGLVASRSDTPKGMNPAVMATESLTRSRNHFRVQISKLNKWAGVGICDEKFVLNDSKTLGTQKTGINSGYFYQNSGINRLQMYGETSKDDAKPFAVGDIIDVSVDFDANRIYYFHNDKGYIAPTQSLLKEGKLYPCVDMAIGTEIGTLEVRNGSDIVQIVLRNEDNPELDIDQKIQKLALKEDALDWRTPPSQFPTQWRWDTAPNKKASAIELSHNNLGAKRETGGNNPAIMTTEPFTRNSWYFVVEVIKVGTWVGIGVADSGFLLNGSKTLGQQTTGVNSSYFVQGAVRKLQMYGEKSIPVDVDPIVPGDLVAIRVDFDNNRIFYFNNDCLQGVIQCNKNVLQEGKIYPCVDMSTKTHVVIRNVDHLPITVAHCR